MTTYAVAIAALVAMAFIRFAIIAPFKVRGRSMEPTLDDGDRVLVLKCAYWRRGPQIGDIVLLRNPEPHSKRRVLLKRVTASTPAGAYFVVGDNAAGSRDSRHFGYVLPEEIIGRVVNWRIGK